MAFQSVLYPATCCLADCLLSPTRDLQHKALINRLQQGEARKEVRQPGLLSTEHGHKCTDWAESVTVTRLNPQAAVTRPKLCKATGS
jgi:hypothetical protein